MWRLALGLLERRGRRWSRTPYSVPLPVPLLLCSAGVTQNSEGSALGQSSAGGEASASLAANDTLFATVRASTVMLCGSTSDASHALGSIPPSFLTRPLVFSMRARPHWADPTGR